VGGWKRLVIGIFSMLLILIAPITLCAAWSGSDSFSPSTIHRGENTRFTFTLRIDDSRSTDVSWVSVHFGWQPSGTVYYFKADDGTRVSIPGYSTHDFNAYVTVPETALGQYSVEIKVNAQATGDWLWETHTFTIYVVAVLTITFYKPDGSLLTNTTIYYGTSSGQETSYLGETNSHGRITSVNLALGGRTIYFKSSDGTYSGSTYVSSTGGSSTVQLTETRAPGPPWVIVIVLLFVAMVVAAVVYSASIVRRYG